LKAVKGEMCIEGREKKTVKREAFNPASRPFASLTQAAKTRRREERL
jgi:hypothetical protein